MSEFTVADGETWGDKKFKISYKNLGTCGHNNMFWKMEIRVTFDGVEETKIECSETCPPIFTTHDNSISIKLRKCSRSEVRGRIEKT